VHLAALPEKKLPDRRMRSESTPEPESAVYVLYSLCALTALLILPFAIAFAEHAMRSKRRRNAPPAAATPGASEWTRRALAGEDVVRTRNTRDGGVGTAVFCIDAPHHLVLDTLSSFEQYPSRVPDIVAVEVEAVETAAAARAPDERAKRWRVTFDVRVVVWTLRMCLLHTMHADGLTWQLQPSRSSSRWMRENRGSWRVDAVGPNRSLVRYDICVDMRVAVPTFLRNAIVAHGVPRALGWVR
jgi:hypothetical protein